MEELTGVREEREEVGLKKKKIFKRGRKGVE